MARMRRLGRGATALLLGAALAMGGVPTPAVAEAIGHATVCEEGVVTDPDGVEAVEDAPEAEAGSDPSEPESATVPAQSLSDLLPDLLPEAPSGSLASQALGGVEYVDENGNAHTCSDYTDISTVESKKANALWGGWYVVRSDRTFPDYTLDIHGDVNIILCDGATLRCAHGIRNAKSLGSSLTIWGQEKGTGKLLADAGAVDEAAGIGGFFEYEDGGTLVVHGGTLRAWGGDDAAGIGGARRGFGGETVVYGGTVQAWGGEDAAGVGGGYDGNGGRISVLGGSVYAYGDDNAAGLGGGEYGFGGDISISGGYVHAEADKCTKMLFSSDYFSAAGAGIGGGEDYEGGTITITGGLVEAYGGLGVYGSGAGIGGGDGGSSGTITISGGEVHAVGGDDDAAGIGGGRGLGGGGLGGFNCRLYRHQDKLGGNARNVTINGGHVFAHGHQAIGYGKYGEGEPAIDYSKVRAISGKAEGNDVELTDTLGEGICGGCTWCLGAYGALTIAPADGAPGALADADRSGEFAFPWLARRDEIRSVTFRDGVVLPAASDHMFDGCSSLGSADLSGCDASGAKDMSGMFRGCSSLATLDLSGWDVSGVEDVSHMFKNCSSLSSLDLSGWKLGHVSSVFEAFFGCSSLASLDLSGWDVSSCTSPYAMGGVFEGCTSLSEISVGEGFDVSRAFPEPPDGSCGWLSLADAAFYTVDEIASSRVGVADTYLACSRCGDCAWFLTPDGALTIAPASEHFVALADADRSGEFAFPWLARRDEIRSVTFREGVRLPADSGGMFDGCSSLGSADLSGCDASGAINMSYMFDGCSSLSSLDLSRWDVSCVKDMSDMFRGCSSLATLDLSGWDVSGVEDVSHMFENCSSLSSLGLSGWKLWHVSSVFEAFFGCSSLASLDLSGWDVSNCTSPYAICGVFDGCASLAQITVGEGFDVSLAFPEAASDAGMWWSVADAALYTLEEIASSRVGVADTYLACSRCGGCAWILAPDGTLTVAPADGVSGALADADRSGEFAFPWLARRDEIRSVTFLEGVGLPADSGGMFDGCSSLGSADLSGCDASGAENFSCMFRGCSSLASLDLSAWGVSGAAYDISRMFEGCASLASLDLSGWKARGIFNAVGAFSGCSSLTSLDLSGWELSRFMLPSNMGRMFDGCASLSEISVGEGFDVSRAFPEPTSDAGKWWSVADGKWYTVDEIASSRTYVADTYLTSEPSA